MIVYAVVDDALSPDFPHGAALEARSWWSCGRRLLQEHVWQARGALIDPFVSTTGRLSGRIVHHVGRTTRSRPVGTLRKVWTSAVLRGMRLLL